MDVRSAHKYLVIIEATYLIENMEIRLMLPRNSMLRFVVSFGKLAKGFKRTELRYIPVGRPDHCG